MKKKKFNIAHYILTGVIVLIILISTNIYKAKPKSEITYNEFIQKVENKEIVKSKFDSTSSEIKSEDKDGNIYKSLNPKSADFRKYLLEKGVAVSEPFNLSALISLCFYLFLGSVLLSTVKVTKPTKFSSEKNGQINILNREIIKFEDVVGHDGVKKDLDILVDFLKSPKKFKDTGAEMPKGVILAGEPGTGKTLLAKALAGEAGVPFYSVSGSEFMELYVGVGAKRVRELFEQARKTAPSIVFIDEIDSIGKKRSSGVDSNSEREQTINQLLKEMDGFTKNEGVLVIGATNRLEILDDALIRPGRFDKHVIVPRPQTPEERLEFLKLFTKNKKLSENVELKNIAKETIGFAGADIKSLVNEATLISITDNKEFVDKECFDKAMFKTLLKGYEKKDSNRNEDEIKLVAWHEAGHTLVAKLITDLDVPKVTIIPSTSGAGGVTFITPNKMGLHSLDDLKNNVRISYGGRIAEELLLKDKNKITTGASSDIQNATNTIMQIIQDFGMCENIGLLNTKIANVNKEYIFEEAKKLSSELYEETKELLSSNVDILKNLADNLIDKETIHSDEIDEIIETSIEERIIHI